MFLYTTHINIYTHDILSTKFALWIPYTELINNFVLENQEKPCITMKNQDTWGEKYGHPKKKQNLKIKLRNKNRITKKPQEN